MVSLQLSLDSIRSIVRKPIVMATRLVDSYRIQYGYYVDSTNSEFKAPWNHLTNIASVFTPADIAIQTPNSDTPYSFAGLDLRSEPIVLTLPAVDENRYYSIQFVDAYTFNFDYLGTRTSGGKAGKYLVVGPNWNGEVPEGINRVVKSETEFISLLYRTQLFNPDDIDNVKKIQAGYEVQPLSSFLNTPPGAVAPAIDFIKPLTPELQKSSLDFFRIMNFVMQFCPTNPTETELIERFAKIGIGAGKEFDVENLSPEVKAAFEDGIKEAWSVDFAQLMEKVNEGQVASGDVFGTRAYLKNNYLYRMAGAVLGIYGNSKEEAMYPFYGVDSDGNKLDATTNKYTLHFAEGELPPVNAFWSLTMYKLPQSLLVENSINRYLLNSPMLSGFVKDKDGGITLYIQNESPREEQRSQLVACPKRPICNNHEIVLARKRKTALDGSWKSPALNNVKNETNK